MLSFTAEEYAMMRKQRQARASKSAAPPTFPEHTAVMIGGHTLGVMRDGKVQILRASVVRGSPYYSWDIITLPKSGVRQATENDFEVMLVKYHPDYLVSETPVPRS